MGNTQHSRSSNHSNRSSQKNSRYGFDALKNNPNVMGEVQVEAKSNIVHYVNKQFIWKDGHAPQLPRGAEQVILGMGCFWCSELLFMSMTEEDGMYSTSVGYFGGTRDNPTRENVTRGGTFHCEVVKLVYDPRKISFKNILATFFENHDPTQENGQGMDFGTQFRSGIWYFTENQRELAEEAKGLYEQQLIFASNVPRAVVTTIESALGKTYWMAEECHQQYDVKPDVVRYFGLVATGVRHPWSTKSILKMAKGRKCSGPDIFGPLITPPSPSLSISSSKSVRFIDNCPASPTSKMFPLEHYLIRNLPKSTASTSSSSTPRMDVVPEEFHVAEQHLKATMTSPRETATALLASASASAARSTMTAERTGCRKIPRGGLVQGGIAMPKKRPSSSYCTTDPLAKGGCCPHASPSGGGHVRFNAQEEESRRQVLFSIEGFWHNLQSHFEAILPFLKRFYDVQTCMVSVLAMDRQFHRVAAGLDVSSVPRCYSFCTLMMDNNQCRSRDADVDSESDPPLMVIPDASQHEAFKNNPLVKGGINIRFYAGVPLTLKLKKENITIGALCILDDKPCYNFDPSQLLASANEVMKLLQPAADLFRMLGSKHTVDFLKRGNVVCDSQPPDEVTTPKGSIEDIVATPKRVERARMFDLCQQIC